MTKFIASVARRLATCADYIDALSTDMQRTQREHARELEIQMAHNVRRLSHELGIDPSAYCLDKVVRISKRHQIDEIRTNRRRTRSNERRAKQQLRDTLFAQ